MPTALEWDIIALVEHVPVAKLDIASDSDSEDRGFESRRVRSRNNALSGVFFVSVGGGIIEPICRRQRVWRSRGAKRRQPAGYAHEKMPERAFFCGRMRRDNRTHMRKAKGLAKPRREATQMLLHDCSVKNKSVTAQRPLIKWDRRTAAEGTRKAVAVFSAPMDSSERAAVTIRMNPMPSTRQTDIFRMACSCIKRGYNKPKQERQNRGFAPGVIIVTLPERAFLWAKAVGFARRFLRPVRCPLSPRNCQASTYCLAGSSKLRGTAARQAARPCARPGPP